MGLLSHRGLFSSATSSIAGNSGSVVAGVGGGSCAGVVVAGVVSGAGVGVGGVRAGGVAGVGAGVVVGAGAGVVVAAGVDAGVGVSVGASAVAVVGLHWLSPILSQIVGDGVGDNGVRHILMDWETMVGGTLVWERICWSDTCNTLFLVWNSEVFDVLALS